MLPQLRALPHHRAGGDDDDGGDVSGDSPVAGHGVGGHLQCDRGQEDRLQPRLHLLLGGRHRDRMTSDSVIASISMPSHSATIHISDEKTNLNDLSLLIFKLDGVGPVDNRSSTD